MQNPHVKYLKTKNSFYLFYHEQNSLFCRHYAENGWTIPRKIAENAAPVFSLCQYGDMTYLLYSSREGNLSLASSRDLSNWEHRPMIDGSRNTVNTRFFLLPTETTFHMIYHLPTETTGVDTLYYTAFREGRWEPPSPIDRFIPMQKTPFLARRLSREHSILYYRTGRNVLSTREILLEPCTMGRVTPLLQTPAPWADLSIVNDTEKIHLLYILRGMFRAQVLYQYKHSSGISTPRVLWEGNSCGNCLAYLQEGKVILMWTVNGQPLRCISENGGISFTPAERLTEPFPRYCTKGELLGIENASWNAMECYGDVQQGFLPAAFPSPALPAATKAAERPKPLPKDITPSTASQEDYRQQVKELTTLLTQRSDEIAAVNAHWKTEMEKLQAKLTSLQQENAQLKAMPTETEKDV